MNARGSLVDPRQIKAARALASWSQADLGQALGVHERQIRFWEKRVPSSPKKLNKIISAFALIGIEFSASPNIGVRFSSDT